MATMIFRRALMAPGRPGTMVRKNIISAMAVLTLASGSLDVTAFLRLGGVFASVMTSNLVFVGIAVVKAERSLVTHCAVALVSYIVGVGTATAVAKPGAGTGRPCTRRANFVLGGEFLLLVAYALWWIAAGAHPKGWAQLVLLGAVALAMGSQGVAARELAGAEIATTYLTGTLTGVVGSLAGRRRPDPVATVVLVSLLVGAAAGAALIEELPVAVPLLAVAAIGGALALVSREEASRRPLPPAT
jgi:uncharacterized membrane protein YoaK (UPF0700 family)